MDCAEVYERLGSPEGELALAEAVVYLAITPKSNAVYVAYDRVRQSVARIKASPFIPHKDAVRGFVFDVASGKLNEVI